MIRSRAFHAVMTAALVVVVLGLASSPAVAQHRTAPLTVEGAHQRSVHSAAVTGVGGTALMVTDHASTMLRNPATLGTVSGIQISVGGVHRSVDRSQVQHYAPVRYYPNLSLLLEGLTYLIPDPAPGTVGFTPADSVQRPPDDISPNWTEARRSTAPLQAFVSVPFELGGTRMVAGFGATEYGDFGYFYQNNNALSPNVLSQRPVPIARPTDDEPLDVAWHQVTRSRQGSVMGYGGALAVEWARHGVTFGASGTYVHGSTEDFEQEVARGRLRFFANEFRVESLGGGDTRTGRSEFSGFDTAVGVTVRGEQVTVGVNVRPPMTLTRRYATESASEAGFLFMEGEDRVSLPWRGNAGIAMTPRDNLTLGLEYEIQPYGSARFQDAQGGEHYPWMSSSAFRFGVEYEATPWLALRSGMRREAEPFGADGRALEDDPVWFTAYALGAGFSVAGAQLNLAFETRDMSYEDVMGTAIHYNRERQWMLVADVVYSLNRSR